MKISELTSLNFRFQLSSRKLKNTIDYKKLVGFKDADTFGERVIQKSYTDPPRRTDIIDFLI